MKNETRLWITYSNNLLWCSCCENSLRPGHKDSFVSVLNATNMVCNQYLGSYVGQYHHFSVPFLLDIQRVTNLWYSPSREVWQIRKSLHLTIWENANAVPSHSFCPDAPNMCLWPHFHAYQKQLLENRHFRGIYILDEYPHKSQTPWGQVAAMLWRIRSVCYNIWF